MTRTVFMGTPEFAVASLDALVAASTEIVGVFTRPDRPAGRGQRLDQSPVKRYADDHGLPVFQPDSFRSSAELSRLRDLCPELIVVAAYGVILPPPVLDLPPFGCINVHGSLLPRHRGASPIAAAILAGDREAGVTIMKMDAGVDTGPTLASAALPVLAGDTTGSLTDRLAVLGADLLVQTLPPWLRGELEATPQGDDGATFAPRIAKEDGRIDWHEPAAVIERRVRAYQPWPAAFTTWDGQLLKVIGARVDARRPLEIDPSPSPTPDGLGVGTVVAGPRGTAAVVTGDGLLWLETVQLQGRKTTPIRAFLAGARGFIGAHLGQSGRRASGLSRA